VLIGGLGMGFTLRAAQAVAPPDARLIVSEIVPELIGWAEKHMAAVFGDSLSDSRVDVMTGDVGSLIREASVASDAILLDIDNGPDGLTRAGNDLLYREDGLQSSRRALAPGGVLAVWPLHRTKRSRNGSCGAGSTSAGIRSAPAVERREPPHDLDRGSHRQLIARRHLRRPLRGLGKRLPDH
jgi:spermidine synthase